MGDLYGRPVCIGDLVIPFGYRKGRYEPSSVYALCIGKDKYYAYDSSIQDYKMKRFESVYKVEESEYGRLGEESKAKLIEIYKSRSLDSQLMGDNYKVSAKNLKPGMVLSHNSKVNNSHYVYLGKWDVYYGGNVINKNHRIGNNGVEGHFYLRYNEPSEIADLLALCNSGKESVDLKELLFGLSLKNLMFRLKVVDYKYRGLTCVGQLNIPELSLDDYVQRMNFTNSGITYGACKISDCYFHMKKSE